MRLDRCGDSQRQYYRCSSGNQGTRQTRSNERGEFNVPFVRIGECSITAETQGFRTQTQTGIVVQVDQTVRVEFTLQIGTITEQVEVTTAAPLVDTSTSSLGQVITNRKILDLPLSGRNAFALGLLAGNTIRPVARGPVSSNLDFSLFKNSRPRERLNVQLRAEAFNLSNTPTFTLPSASNTAFTIGNPNFGKLASSSATGRQIQFGLKLNF
ncbi:MAG: carboxypeptidase-like regulatory domain-containing protein [Bryobacteraceae bacterium]